MDIRRAFDDNWADPSKRLHDLLGRRGFELPKRANLEWVEIGGDNWVLVNRSPNWDRGRSFHIEPNASGNIVVFGENCTAIGTVHFRGNKNVAIIGGPDSGRTPLHLPLYANEQLFFWGQGATSNTTTFVLAYDHTRVLVGEWCMFSASIMVRTGDEHAIFDATTGETVNPGKDVIFEPHVWVGYGAAVMKGVTVGFGSIIGAHSVVTESVPRKCVVAGAPARIIRENVSWASQRTVADDTAAKFRAYEQTLTDTLARAPLGRT